MHSNGARSIPKFAADNGVSPRTIYLEIGAGRLTARKIGARTVITDEDGAEWRQALPKMTPATAA